MYCYVCYRPTSWWKRLLQTQLTTALSDFIAKYELTLHIIETHSFGVINSITTIITVARLLRSTTRFSRSKVDIFGEAVDAYYR